jgi:starch synthase
MTGIEVLAVASEAYPLVKTGGLADVVGALPGALAHEGVRVRTLLPGYPGVLSAIGRSRVVHRRADLFGGPVQVLAAHAHGIDVLVLDAAHLFDRTGNPYTDPDGKDWPDNAIRFAALARCGADIALGALPHYRPQIVHVHDWQAGLTLAYLHFAPSVQRPKSVVTIHNLAFQGVFPAHLLSTLELPPEAFAIDGIEYHNAISYLKAGVHYADRITTVSPTYALEILTPESGMGFDGILRARGSAVTGILNGLDTKVWNPAADLIIVSRFDENSIAARVANKPALQSQMGLNVDANAPLFGVVSRLSWQKGLDLLLAVLPTLVGEGAQLALLGSGDATMEAGYRAAAAANPGRIACRFGYDETVAHRIQAGADALLVPSRFEPCGLTQLSALRYGTVPVVARVGGLADTVIDASPMAVNAGVATGVQFAPVTPEMLSAAIRRTVALYRQPDTWKRLQANGMAADVSWRDPARRYAALYRELVTAAA